MKTAIITGANRGIGLEFCKQLQDLGYQVVALCRSASPELISLNVRIFEDVDITILDSIEKVTNKLKGETIDLLINNAGILVHDSLEDLKGTLKQLEVNALGPLLVSSAFSNLMVPGSKIVMITSLMGSIADNSSGGYYGYRMSKAALNMAAVSLSLDLKDRKIAVALLSPGSVKTDMTNNKGNLNPKDSVKQMLDRIDELNSENSGTFWHYQGEVLPW